MRRGVRREVGLFGVDCGAGESSISALSEEEAVDVNWVALDDSTAGSAVEDPDAGE